MLEHLEIASLTNGAANVVAYSEPYVAAVQITGTAPLLFHRWNNEAVDAKSKAAKGSKAKKSDDIESYVYRDKDGVICLPGEYLRQSVIWAAKFAQDPRSPRKSAMDLFKAGVIALTILAPLKGNPKQWDYLDKRRVTVQRNAVTRIRPAFLEGWSAKIELQVALPEYISPEFLNDRIQAAGRLVGVADNRPTFGRYQVVSFKTRQG